MDQPQRAADLLKQKMDRWRVSLFGERLHVITDGDAERGQASITAMLAEAGIRVVSAREARFSLEDVFISVVEQARLQGTVFTEG